MTNRNDNKKYIWFIGLFKVQNKLPFSVDVEALLDCLELNKALGGIGSLVEMAFHLADFVWEAFLIVFPLLGADFLVGLRDSSLLSISVVDCPGKLCFFLLGTRFPLPKLS
jgi:hypothetical protein